MSTTCLEENEIVDLVTGGLDSEAAARTEVHIDACAGCRMILIELARVFELRASSLPEVEPEENEGSTERGSESGLAELLPAALVRGTTIGWYLVVGTLGAGAMGVIHAAFDPELDRKIALKLLRSRVEKGSNERLVREARATARLAHPNVVVSVVNRNRAKHTWVCDGDTKQGQAWAETAVEQAKVSFGEEHSIVGKFALTAAELALDNDDAEAARRHFELKQQLTTAEPTQTTRARMLHVEAGISEYEGRAAEGQALLARAIPLLPGVTRWLPLRTRILAMQARLSQ